MDYAGLYLGFSIGFCIGAAFVIWIVKADI